MRIFGIIMLSVIGTLFSVTAFAKSFSDNGDNTVKDNETALVWQKAEGGIMDWESAISYCEGLGLGGDNTWRLPSKRELISLLDYTMINPALSMDYFPQVNSSFYWTSTTDAGGSGDYAWGVFFASGTVNSNRKMDFYRVRCVR